MIITRAMLRAADAAVRPELDAPVLDSIMIATIALKAAGPVEHRQELRVTEAIRKDNKRREPPTDSPDAAPSEQDHRPASDASAIETSRRAVLEDTIALEPSEVR